MNVSARETTLTEDIGSYLRHQLRGRRGLIAAAVIVAGPALWFGWPWLVAAGLAPLLLAMAPCAVMCGLGLCMNMACKKSHVGSSASEGVAGELQRASVGTDSERSSSLGASFTGNSPAETEAPR